MSQDIIGIEIADGKILSLVDGHRAQYYVGLDASKSASPGIGDTYLAYDTNREYICYSTGSWTFNPRSKIGTDASKTSSPIAGEVYMASDTGKTYQCFVDDIWSLVNSPVYEEYFNHTGISDNIFLFSSSNNGTVLTDSTNHEVDISTGITSPGQGVCYINRSITPYIENLEANFKVDNIVYGTGGIRTFVIGVSGYHCEAHFRQTGTESWKTYTDAGSGATSTDIATIVDGDKLTIKNYGIIILFFVNGTLVSSHLTTTYDALLNGQLMVDATGSGAVTVAREISVDYIGMKVLN